MVMVEKFLADRFGLGLSFYPISERRYFQIVEHLFGQVKDRQQLYSRAPLFH